MASEDIANLALARLGAAATVSNMDPPDGSPHAEHCARFYPIARNSLLEMHAWGFATKRLQLAQVANNNPVWSFAYAGPSTALSYLKVYAAGDEKPRAFAVEADADGNDVIYTNQEDAILQYSVVVTDSTKFSPLFTDALAWLLASYVAGPVLKGNTGIKMSQACLKAFYSVKAQATVSDASDANTEVEHTVPWMEAR